MAEAKSHQERAEKASYLVTPRAVDEWRADAVAVIARETFPAELVQAARKALSIAGIYLPTWESDAPEDLSSALALYPEKEARE